jgi:hypothetical protein
VLVFDVILNGTSLFNHSNIWMPVTVDRALPLGYRHAGHAPHTPFRVASGNKLEFWFQSALVGSFTRDLSGRACSGVYRYDLGTGTVSGPPAVDPRQHPRPTVHWDTRAISLDTKGMTAVAFLVRKK